MQTAREPVPAPSPDLLTCPPKAVSTPLPGRGAAEAGWAGMCSGSGLPHQEACRRPWVLALALCFCPPCLC